MKQTMIAITVVLLSLLSSCTVSQCNILSNTNINNINEQFSKEIIKMIKIDRELYYDIRKRSECTACCGTTDGSMTRSADRLFYIGRKRQL